MHMLRILTILVWLLVGRGVYAQEGQLTGQPTAGDQVQEVVEDSLDKIEAAADEVKASAGASRSVRRGSAFHIALNYSLLDLVVPSKKGATLAYVEDADTSYELEYLQGDIKVPFVVKDLGAFTETRISLVRRSYFETNSFNLVYGMSYIDSQLDIGSEDLSAWTGGAYPYLNLVEVRTLGFNVGLGNRWSFDSGFTIGADWFGWAQPIAVIKRDVPIKQYISNDKAKENLDDTVGLLAFLPRFYAAKLHIGWMF
jgi:hypothetical protein